ncbi:hypothetical protein AB1Y20_003281 [Prymnesium parvum]|uniref:SAM domain-containing protein n=1 Tax=Prymnesium parvum TaxID=97485 RepID=A0AB34JCZ4_PRYPA
MSGVHEVEAFLTEMGLQTSIPAVINGFYTSMEALKGATFDELVEVGVRPVHAKLIISHLGNRTAMPPFGTPAPASDSNANAEELASFLRSVGLENCQSALTAAGYTSLDALGEAGMQDLLNAGLKPVHARLIVSNMDSASTTGISLTPASQRVISLDEETLLGGPNKRKNHRARWYIGAAIAFLLLFLLWPKLTGGGTPAVSADPPVKRQGKLEHAHKIGAAKEGIAHAVAGSHMGVKAKGKGANMKAPPVEEE